MNSVTSAMNLCSVASLFLPTFKNCGAAKAWWADGFPGATKQPGGKNRIRRQGQRAGSLDSTSSLSPQGLRKTGSQSEPLRLPVVSWFFKHRNKEIDERDARALNAGHATAPAPRPPWARSARSPGLGAQLPGIDPGARPGTVGFSVPRVGVPVSSFLIDTISPSGSSKGTRGWRSPWPGKPATAQSSICRAFGGSPTSHGPLLITTQKIRVI